MGGLTGFRNRDYSSTFPDRGELRVRDREVEEGGEKRECAGTKVLEVKHGNAIRTDGG